MSPSNYTLFDAYGNEFYIRYSARFFLNSAGNSGNSNSANSRKVFNKNTSSEFVGEIDGKNMGNYFIRPVNRP